MSVSETIGQEAVFLGTSILVGTVLFLAYDVLRIFRRMVPHGNLWIGIEDFLYWLFCTAAVFVLLYRENDGMVRGFAFGGIVIGMLLYYVTLSRLLIRVNVFLFGKLGGILGKLFGTVLGPPVKIGKKFTVFLIKRLKKVWQAVKMGLCKL